ncbi:hypothetical protein ACFY19_35605 [Streptosporangium saharense]|uniref:hypothetical protein n=1 Tax=Streptosporangium saharense TaxID=1706840 RepID=UPI0036C84A0F
MAPVIYPARRAVEHAVALPGVRPVRLFPVLWPFWQVEITANVYEEQAYEVIDRFLVRAVVEGGVDDRDELIRFFGLEPPLVDRCLAFLSVIGHLTVERGRVRMTDLGLRSVRAGVRYEPKESRQKLLIERFTGRPLPRGHYQTSPGVLPSPEVPDELLTDRTRFLSLFTPVAFQPQMINDLAARSDRTEYNLPGQLREIRGIAAQDAYMPAYLIETDNRSLLAYTAAVTGRDPFLEAVCRDVPAIHMKIEAERRENPRDLWTAWLASSQLGPGQPRQLPNGVWRVTLRPAAFGGPPKLPLSRLGSFQLRKHHFIQLWCEDVELRSRATSERALSMTRLREVRTRADLAERIDGVAAQLEVTPPSFAQLRDYARRERLHDRLASLEALE